jgi:hypothetical protein
VTGESPEELACTEKVGVQACLLETDGDCCEGQFCGEVGVCDTCSELIGYEGLPCRAGHPNDCCSGQFCNVDAQCQTCPSGRGAGSEGPYNICFGPDPLFAACTADEECQSRAAGGEFDHPLLSGGFDPSSIASAGCSEPGGEITEESGCCLVVTKLVEACQGLEPPPEGDTCETAACETDEFCNGLVEGATCFEGCCVPPTGGDPTCIPECDAEAGDQCGPGPPGYEDVGFCLTPPTSCPDLGPGIGLKCGSGVDAQSYCTAVADFFGPSTCTEGCSVPDPMPPPP